jgi:hypothetical protein
MILLVANLNPEKETCSLGNFMLTDLILLETSCELLASLHFRDQCNYDNYRCLL